MRKQAKRCFYYFILNITLRLQKTPQFNISYGAIQNQLDQMGVSELSIKAVSDAVIAIRQSKLPNPAEIGNAGSFFKNPIVSLDCFQSIAKAHEQVPHYPAADGNVKLAAGWLIDQAGWKGKRIDDFGVHKNQETNILKAHAWLKTGDEFITGQKDHEEYTVVSYFT